MLLKMLENHQKDCVQMIKSVRNIPSALHRTPNHEIKGLEILGSMLSRNSNV